MVEYWIGGEANKMADSWKITNKEIKLKLRGEEDIFTRILLNGVIWLEISKRSQYL